MCHNSGDRKFRALKKLATRNIFRFKAVFIAEVFSRREIPICDHDGHSEFGLIRLEKAPIADVESGLRSTDGNGTQISHPTSHTVTITQELTPNLNAVDNQPPMGQQRL